MNQFKPTEKQIQLLKAIPSNQLKRPSMPIAVYLQEANNLYVWSKNDWAELLDIGLSAELLDTFILRFELLTYFQGRWSSEKRQSPIAMGVFQDKLKEGKHLYSMVTQSFRYAFRKHLKLQEELRQIARKSPHAALYQSLNDLAVLGKVHQDLLQSIGFDLSALDQARRLSDELPGLDAAAHQPQSDTKDLRDRAYAYLKQAVDELSTCGQYVFRNDENKRAGYRSQYLRRKGRAQQQSRNNEKRR
ncbi:hypothetical protein [uncultured Sunxiuqinia sp.]|uniref:hypothetical protein n=1 Tax=uncultured Sunxiuqinia sp. TaxID=1573825 RepID=UPI002AA7704D|nr:hypothetical protein [uncultured Sunxiuqinia sp.]